jgi:hypothetical protein
MGNTISYFETIQYDNEVIESDNLEKNEDELKQTKNVIETNCGNKVSDYRDNKLYHVDNYPYNSYNVSLGDNKYGSFEPNAFTEMLTNILKEERGEDVFVEVIYQGDCFIYMIKWVNISGLSIIEGLSRGCIIFNDRVYEVVDSLIIDYYVKNDATMIRGETVGENTDIPLKKRVSAASRLTPIITTSVDD